MKVKCVRKPTKEENIDYNFGDIFVPKLKIGHIYEAEIYNHLFNKGDYSIGDYLYPSTMFKTEFEYQLEDIINEKE